MRFQSQLAALGAALILTSTTTFAGPVSGQLLDPSGRAVAGAHVFVNTDRGIVASTSTSADGRFTLTAPDRGRYEVLVAAPGLSAPPLVEEGSPEPRTLAPLTLAISAVRESVVVSAAQVEVPLSQATSTVTVITGGELQDRQLATVADALRAVPGLAVAATGGAGAVTAVFPRGGESNYTLVMLDDVPVNTFGGDFDFGHLSTANVERIEIVRGPQSALFGSNAIGAVVRVITRRGGAPSGEAAVEAGSFGLSRLSAAGSGSRGGWTWGGSAERLASDGFNGQTTDAGIVTNDNYERQTFAGSAGWRHGSGASFRGALTFGRDDRGFPGPFGSNPIGAYGGIDDVSRGEHDRLTAALTGTVPVNARLRTTVQVVYNRIAGDFLSPFGPSESASRRLGVRGQADFAVAPGLDLSAGVEALTERASSTFITGADFQPVPIDRAAAGYFAEARWQHAQRLFVTAGLRVDDIRRGALEGNPDPFSPRPAMADESVLSANPKVATAWIVRPDVGNRTRVRASIGTGIRPPDGFEIAFTDNPSLKPERSVSAEAGVEQSLAGGRVLLEATAFANDYDDLIIAVGSFAESSRYRTDNISNARARGLELSGTARARIPAATPIDLHLRAGYTLLETKVLAVDQGHSAPPPFEVGDPLLRRPRHQFSLDLGVSAGRFGAFVHGGGRGRAFDVEPSTGTFGGLFYADGYSVWNAGGSWRLTRNLELFGRVTNLFDRRYEEAFGFPALGRGAAAGLRIAAGR